MPQIPGIAIAPSATNERVASRRLSSGSRSWAVSLVGSGKDHQHRGSDGYQRPSRPWKF